ncbi:unnamed protein product [Caenorhabditis brenneri]
MKRQLTSGHPEGIPVKRYCEPGTSGDVREEGSSAERLEPVTPIDILEYELQQSTLNVQEIGRIIADGVIEKTITDDSLKELTKKLAKNVHAMANINVWSLSEDLGKGTIDSRLVVIGNAFLWNLLKSSMATVRDKFDHYHFKMSTITTAMSAPCTAEFSTTRVRVGQHFIQGDTIFKSLDLLEIYNSVVFRKTGDLHNKSKQFVKAYFSIAAHPRCAIWHYSLRQGGSSHKKWLQDIPKHVLDSLLQFQLALAGLDAPELDTTDDDSPPERKGFFMSLGDTDEARLTTFNTLKAAREQFVIKFRTNVTDALNETREMPYNTITRELMAPPRGKPIDNHHCVTWRQYESLIKRCEQDPSKENLQAKQDLDYKLMLSYQHRGEEEVVEIDVEEDVKMN